MTAEIIKAFQALQRAFDDLDKKLILSVTAVSGGTAYNIIPDTVKLRGTVRTLDPARDKRSTRANIASIRASSTPPPLICAIAHRLSRADRYG